MRKTCGVFLLLGACFALASGQTTKPVASSAAEAIKQLERDWNAAQKARDIDKLDKIIADDWSGLSFDGNRTTKTIF